MSEDAKFYWQCAECMRTDTMILEFELPTWEILVVTIKCDYCGNSYQQGTKLNPPPDGLT